MNPLRISGSRANCAAISLATCSKSYAIGIFDAWVWVCEPSIQLLPEVHGLFGRGLIAQRRANLLPGGADAAAGRQWIAVWLDEFIRMRIFDPVTCWVAADENPVRAVG
ncbi:MAG: hypothetical protein KDI49_01145 [Gammaproteobacteria bacterium]|nr:hypothetical protein [Gammaproteobacteria bacterium]